MTKKRLPPRSTVKVGDTWDLASLYASDAAWEKDFKRWQKQTPEYAKFRGRLAEGPHTVRELFDFDAAFDRLGDRLGTYAYLKASEDQANSDYQRMTGRYQAAATTASEAASWIRPELLALPAAKLEKYLAAKELAPYALALRRIIRFQPHTLGPKEEHLLAMQGEMSQAAGKAFRQLLDADLKFGFVKNERGEEVELGNSTFLQLLNSPNRGVRKTAFHQFYSQFQGHENTLAATLQGSVQKDVYYAKARGFASAREAALFPDNVPVSVYDNLVATVHKFLPALHRYYSVRQRAMRLKEIHQYDCYVPILADLEVKHTWPQAVKTIVAALEPLGSEYCATLERGLTGRWCDRYPNQGKQSGAFSSGSYDGDPYILMNFQTSVLDQVFTLAHEAGHSMHSHYSARNQPYQYWSYAIFVAEVASTFNEELLGHYLLERAPDKRHRAYLVNRAIDDIRGTLFRQTMFAEFEQQIHAQCEAGEPLTVQSLKETYHQLLVSYFGPNFTLDACLDLECLRIPHFYRAFYVYKYATGLSAAIALSQRVLGGGQQELAEYLTFLKGGCSQDPLDLLRGAGVDMSKSAPIAAALRHFENLVTELDELL